MIPDGFDEALPLKYVDLCTKKSLSLLPDITI